MNINKIKNVKKRNMMLLIILLFTICLLNLDDENIFHYFAQNNEIPIDAKKVIVNKYFINIDLDAKKLFLYHEDKKIKVYSVSGGKPSTPSPLGRWRIISKDTWGEGFGGGWLGFNVPWGKYGIHGTIYPWLIGQNSSKGCIRIKNKELRELYKIVPIGTWVSITHRNPVRRDLEHGNIGSDVLEIQKRLKELKYYEGGLDGRFGSQLRSAVSKYQKDNGIRQTGVVGIKTFNSIFEQEKTKMIK